MTDFIVLFSCFFSLLFCLWLVISRPIFTLISVYKKDKITLSVGTLYELSLNGCTGFTFYSALLTNFVWKRKKCIRDEYADVTVEFRAVPDQITSFFVKEKN